MRIVFNFHGVGIGNNGGSRTIIKCAECLQDLGEEVVLSATHNSYVWHPIRVKIMKNIPECDIIVATGIRSVKSTLATNANKKYYYIRGFEKWNASKRDLLNSYKKLRCIVNSKWLYEFLKSHKIDSDIIYPGADFEDLYNERESREKVIGGLYSRRHKTKKHIDVEKISRISGYPAILLNRDIKNPSPTQLRNFYNSIKVWISSSELEGLHNCPLEALLCGCGLVATDHHMGGTNDYAISGVTCMTYPAGDLDFAADLVKSMMEDDSLRCRMVKNSYDLIKNKIGTRKNNMKRMQNIFKK